MKKYCTLQIIQLLRKIGINTSEGKMVQQTAFKIGAAGQTLGRVAS